MPDELAPIHPNHAGLVDTGRSPSDPIRRLGIVSGARRAVGRLVDVVGDAVKAKYGDSANAFQDNLKDIGRKISGKEPEETPESPLPTAREPSPFEVPFLRFSERVNVVLELANLIPEAMSPGGWGWLVRCPLDLARQLHQDLRPLFTEESGWRRVTSNCLGYMENIEQAAKQLERLSGAHRDKGYADGLADKVSSTRSDAVSSLIDLRNALQKLASQAPAFMDRA